MKRSPVFSNVPVSGPVRGLVQLYPPPPPTEPEDIEPAPQYEGEGGPPPDPLAAIREVTTSQGPASVPGLGPPPPPETGTSGRGAGRRLTDLGWLPAVSVGLGVLIVGGVWAFHTPSEAVAVPSTAHVQSDPAPKVTLTAPHWPACFTGSAPDSPARVSASLLNPKTIDDMLYTYAFCLGQQHRAGAIENQHPQLKAAMSAAQSRFEQRFRPAVDNIEVVLSQWNTYRWQSARRKDAAAARQIDATRIPVDKARAYLDAVAARSIGKLPARVLDTLLAFNPEYIADPAREYREGYTRLFQTDVQAAAGPMRIRLKYPRSWTPEAPGSAGLVQRFRDRRSPLTVVAIAVHDLPAGSTIPPELAELFAPSNKGENSSRVTVLDGGTMSLAAGREANWRAIEQTRGSPERSEKVRVVKFVVPCGDKAVRLDLEVGIPADAPDEQLDAAYARSAPLFKLIATSLDAAY